MPSSKLKSLSLKAPTIKAVSKWNLPYYVNVYGEKYKINPDYRNILEIINTLNNFEKSELIRAYAALMLFFEDSEKINDDMLQEALNQMMIFINCGEESADDSAQKSPKLIDWSQDYLMIVSAINKVAGKDVRTEESLHWWTFISYFMEIGEGQLSLVVSIRDKLARGKKLEKWERDFYKNNRGKIDFKRKYTENEELFIKQIIGR